MNVETILDYFTATLWTKGLVEGNGALVDLLTTCLASLLFFNLFKQRF
jgi:hypothetical protein